jgi:protein-arginine kinase activator protein McsA
MLGKCDNCGLENVEVSLINLDSKKQKKLCNQCRPPDGPYGNKN